MKIVFAGPTLHGIALDAYPSIVFRPPAQRGDIVRAVRDGARLIGLIDGVFERMPAVWHKEILFALSERIAVLGAASMGALRAAECHAFGMVGVGEVFEAYASGAAENDDDVAQLHAPPELGYLPLSEPLVNIRATLLHLRTGAMIGQQEQDALDGAAQALFFKDRSYRRVVESADLPASRKAELAGLLKAHSVNVKQKDAITLLQIVESQKTYHEIDSTGPEWRLASNRYLLNLLGDS